MNKTDHYLRHRCLLRPHQRSHGSGGTAGGGPDVRQLLLRARQENTTQEDDRSRPHTGTLRPGEILVPVASILGCEELDSVLIGSDRASVGAGTIRAPLLSVTRVYCRQ